MSDITENPRTSRLSRATSSVPKDYDFEYFIYSSEGNYNSWCTIEHIKHSLQQIEDDGAWNCLVNFLVISCLVLVSADVSGAYVTVADIAFNVIYLIHVIFTTAERARQAKQENVPFTTSKKCEFMFNVLSYMHYASMFALDSDNHRLVKIACYFVRLHTSFHFLWAMMDTNLKGSVVGTALKFCFIFLVIWLTCALIWMHVPVFQHRFDSRTSDRLQVSIPVPYSNNDIKVHINHTEIKDNVHSMARTVAVADITDDSPSSKFFRAAYIINMMFLPIGSIIRPSNDYERVAMLLVMVAGSLVVTGAAVASLALVIGLYMRPEEEFRVRFRLIMDEMKNTDVPQQLRDKVETFYRMYWHKQKAVSVTELLPLFPPTLPCAIYTDIYFEAQQKSTILRDLSYQFLWEIAKVMDTIHYIPGDAIIKRGSVKSSIIFITYGDVEMLTAEDDETPILRFTRGTCLSSCAGHPIMACSEALVEIRAATFCTAHVLTADNLWRVAAQYGVNNGQAFILLSSFEEHIEKVKRHYRGRILKPVKHKSNIVQFKRNLMALKEAKDDDDNYLLARTDFFLEIAGCYIMRNVLISRQFCVLFINNYISQRSDASLIDEADEICLRPTFPCILQPQSSLLLAWHSFVTVVILIVTITHPYCLVFFKNVTFEFRFYDYMVTLIFILDLIVHLSTGANVEEGVPITFAQTSTQQVRSFWFLLDALGTLPIFEFIYSGKFAGINKLLRLHKVFRMLKSMEEVCVYHSNALRLMSYSLLILILCYLIAALQQAYMCFVHGYCKVESLTVSPHWTKAPLTDYVTYGLVFGMYWAMSMLTFTCNKTMYWKPNDWRNLLYTASLLEGITIVYTCLEAMYSATIMVTTALKEDCNSTIANVKNFLIRNGVEPTLRHRFITYLELCWYTDKAFSMTQKKESIFYDLPPHVYQDIVSRQRIKYILCAKFMKYIRKESLKNVSSQARLFYTSPNEILLSTGDINNEIFVIKQGICEMYDPDTQEVCDTLMPTQSFGTLECLLRFPTYYTVRAKTHVQILAIPRKSFQHIIQEPRIKDALEFVKQQPEFLDTQIRRERFLVYEPPPPTPNRSMFPLPRKYESDTEFLLPFTSLGFLSFLRYIFPRFTIRPDGTYIYRYEWLRALCALASSMVYPSYTYMVLQVPWLYRVTWVLDILAYFDICQRMLVGYYNHKGILVYHPSSTAAHYLKGPFLLDLLSCLPLEHLESSRDTTSLSPADLIEANVVSSTSQMLMLNRLLQLYRLPGAMDILPVYFGREDVILVIKSIPLFMILLNVLTCFIVFASVKIYGTIGSDPWRIVPHSDPGGSWIDLFKDTYRFNMTESPWNLHLTIYSWVVYETTSTGYNIFNPSNVQLVQVMVLGMLVGAMMNTYFSVRIISIRANVNKMLANYQGSMKDIAQFMVKEKLDKKLQDQVMAYYEYTWDKTGGTDSRNVLKLCDQGTLRTDTILHLYGETFSKCPILFHCDLSLLRLVGRSVRSVYFLANTCIIQKNDVLTDMFFVDHGTIDIKESKDAIRPLVTLIRGSVFGNLENLTAVLSPNELYVSNNAYLLQINSKVFHRIILDFPTVKVLMKKYRRKNENYILGRADNFPIKNWKPTYAQESLTYLSGGTIAKYFNLNSRGAQYYLILVSLLCIYGDVYNAGFQFNHIALLSCLYILDMGFFMKILLNYILPFIVEAGDARNYLLEARKKYFKSEFKYDIVSCLPIEFLSLIRHDEIKWRLFAFLRLNRLFRIVTIRKCMKFQYSRLSTNLIFSTVVTLVIWFSLFVHSSSCLWYAIGVIEDEKKPGSAWFQKPPSANESVCDNLYICSVYFILTTFTQKGVGDVLPRMQSEVIFTIILQSISTMMFMIYVGEFSNIFQNQSFRSFEYYRKYLELKDFLSNNRVSKNLVTRVEQYSLHLWRESRGAGVQMPHFLEAAPPCFQLKIMAAAYMKHFVDHPVFKLCEPAFLRQLVGCLQLYTYSVDNYVVKEGEITDSMYIVHRGRVVECDEDMDVLVKDYVPGQSFGLINGLTRDVPFTYTYRTRRKAEVLTLQLDAWEHLLHLFPISRYEVYKDVPDHPFNKPPDDYSAASKEKETKIPITGPETTLSPPSTFLKQSKIPATVPAVPLSKAPAAAAGSPWPLDSRDNGAIDTEQLSIISSGSPRELAGEREESKDETEEESSDLEETPPRRNTFIRRLTLQAKKIIGKESFHTENITTKDILKYENSGADKDTLILDEDIKMTSALLHRFERKARQSISEGFLEKSGLERFAHEHADVLHESILTQYIDKREAENAEKAYRKKSLAIRDYTEDNENEVNAVSRAPRRSVVMFGDDEDKPIRILPPSEQEAEDQGPVTADENEINASSRAPRRSVVMFGEDEDKPVRILPLSEAEAEDQVPVPSQRSQRSILTFGDNDIRKLTENKDEENKGDEEKAKVVMAPRRSILASKELKRESQYRHNASEKEYSLVNKSVLDNISTEDKNLNTSDNKTKEVAESSKIERSYSKEVFNKNYDDDSEIAQITKVDEGEASTSKGIIGQQELFNKNYVDGSEIAQIAKVNEGEASASKSITGQQTFAKIDENKFLGEKNKQDKPSTTYKEVKRPNLPIFIEADKDYEPPQKFEFDGSFPFPLRGRISDEDVDKTDIKDEASAVTKGDALTNIDEQTKSDEDIELLRSLSREALAHKTPIETEEDKKFVEDSASVGSKKQTVSRRISMFAPSDGNKDLVSEEKNMQPTLIHTESSNENYIEKVQKPKSTRRISLYVPPAEEDIIEEEAIKEEQKVQEDDWEYAIKKRRASRRTSVFAPPVKDQFNQDILEELDEPMEPIAGSSRNKKLHKPDDSKSAIIGKKLPDTNTIDESDSQESIEGYIESKRGKKRSKSKDETEKQTSRVRYEGDENEEFSQPQPMIDQRRSTTPAPLRHQQRTFSEVIRPTSTLTKEERNAMMMDSDLDSNVSPEPDKKPEDKKPKPEKK